MHSAHNHGNETDWHQHYSVMGIILRVECGAVYNKLNGCTAMPERVCCSCDKQGAIYKLLGSGGGAGSWVLGSEVGLEAGRYGLRAGWRGQGPGRSVVAGWWETERV